MIKSNFYRSPKEHLEKRKHKINGFNLPNTMDFSTWGDYEISEDSKYAIVQKYKSKAKYFIKIKENSLNVDLKLNGKVLYQFTDTRLDKKDLTYFSRKLKTHNYIYKNGNLIIKEIERKYKYLKPIKKNLIINKNLITMDLETSTTNGIMSPVCISIYDGINVSSFYLSNFENSDKMLIAAIESIMKPCYKDNVVYLHNFSYFDAVFLIKILSSFNAKISPIIRDNCIIDFKCKFQYSNNKFITLCFRDSYLLIPSSLSNRSRLFKVLKKDIFPYKFLKLENINYIGSVPLFEEFDNISLEDYNNYVNNYKPHTDKE